MIFFPVLWATLALLGIYFWLCNKGTFLIRDAGFCCMQGECPIGCIITPIPIPLKEKKSSIDFKENFIEHDFILNISPRIMEAISVMIYLKKVAKCCLLTMNINEEKSTKR